ncbi:MAG: hypothetical protein QM759_08850 [Terricaulis sp.]
MRFVWMCAAAAAFVVSTVPARADDAPASDTLQLVTTRGIVATVGGMDLPVEFSADHRFSMLNGAIAGAWRVDATKLCLKGDSDAAESCTEYPLGKRSGDSFVVQAAQGPMTVRIR